jgi:hypothetical protein
MLKDSRLQAFKEMIETLKENNFDDDFISIEITKDGKIEIDTPVESYRGKTLDSTISRALENLQADIDDNVRYWKDLEEDYKRDRHAAGIGSW